MNESIPRRRVPTGARVAILGTAILALGVGATAVVAQSPSPAPSQVPPAATPEPSAEARPEDGRRPERGRRFVGPFDRGEFRLPRRGFPRLPGRGLPGPGRPFERIREQLMARAITVESVDGITLNLITEDGWRRSVDTTEVEITRDGDEITIGDVAVGDSVRLDQTRNDDGTWTVTGIDVVLPVVTGEVGEVGTDSFTITQGDGTTVTVYVSDDTDWHVPGSSAPGLGDLEAGDPVAARGTRRDDGSIDATDVSAGGRFVFERRPILPDPDAEDPDQQVPDASTGVTG
jgi:hypothetical protein